MLQLAACIENDLVCNIKFERSLVHGASRGRISRSGLTQDIKMGSCVFQCDVPHKWIKYRQVGIVSVCCDGVRCHVLCMRHGIPVWRHIGQSITATNSHRRDMISASEPKQTGVQTMKNIIFVISFTVSCMCFQTLNPMIGASAAHVQNVTSWHSIASQFNMETARLFNCMKGIVISYRFG